jgi:ribosomal protein L18E
MQNTLTQAQALNWAAQQLQYVTNEKNEHAFCYNTQDELVVVMQQLLDSETIDFAATIANMRYSNDEVNENKYLEENY